MTDTIEKVTGDELCAALEEALGGEIKIVSEDFMTPELAAMILACHDQSIAEVNGTAAVILAAFEAGVLHERRRQEKSEVAQLEAMCR